MITILRAYKTELEPTDEQRVVLARHVAGARVAHNWALEKWKELDGTRGVALGCRALAGIDAKGGEAAALFGYCLAALIRGEPVKVRTPKSEAAARYRYHPASGVQLPDFRAGRVDWYSQLVSAKEEQPERFGWLSELSAFAVREAVLDVADGWKHFFEHLKAGRYASAGPPRFRGRQRASYHTDQPDPIRVTERAVKIPGVGWVRMKERGYLPVTEEKSHRFIGGGKACGLGVSEKDGRWYVALRCEVPRPFPQKRGPGRALAMHQTKRVPGRELGVEVGVRVLAVASTGERAGHVWHSPLRDDRRIDKFEMLRKRWERRMARRWKDGVKTRDQSQGWKEAAMRVAHYHARIKSLRDDVCGKAARQIADMGAETVRMRGPGIAKMLSRAGKRGDAARTRNRLAKNVHAARMGDLRRRLEYKQAWAGGRLELVPIEEPTTNRCSACNAVRATNAGYPTFMCPTCGHQEDRDDNSAINLLNYRAPSGDPAAGPRSAGLKPPKGDNGRRKRTARAEEKSSVTAPHGDVTSAPGPGNRVSGASHSVRPIDAYHEVPFEQSGDAHLGSRQFGLDTALFGADDPNRSQTESQRSEFPGLLAHGARGTS